MKYSPDGGYVVTLVGENDPPHGLFATDGSFRVTTDLGYGVYAPNGSIRIGNEGSSVYTPSGAWNGTLSGDTFTPISQGGSYPPSYWANGPAPDGYHWEYVYDDTGALVTAPGGTINPTDEPVVALTGN